MRVVMLCEDLMRASRLQASLKSMGADTEWTKSIADLEAALGRMEAEAVIAILDGNAEPVLDWARRYTEEKKGARLLGCVQHGAIPIMRPLAAKAGFDLVVAHSAAAARLPLLIERLVGREEKTLSATEME